MVDGRHVVRELRPGSSSQHHLCRRGFCGCELTVVGPCRVKKPLFSWRAAAFVLLFSSLALQEDLRRALSKNTFNAVFLRWSDTTLFYNTSSIIASVLATSLHAQVASGEYV